MSQVAEFVGYHLVMSGRPQLSSPISVIIFQPFDRLRIPSHSGRLYLPPDFKDILTPEWQTAIKRYQPPLPPKVSHSLRPKPSRTELRRFSATRHTPSPTKPPEPKASRKKRLKVNDRVKTSHGTGTIVEIDGEKYLVDLDGQAAQLWERAWGIRKA